MDLQGLGAVMILISSFPYTFVKLRHAKENGEDRGPRCLLTWHLPGEPPAARSKVLAVSFHHTACTYHTLLGAPRWNYMLAMLSWNICLLVKPKI